MTDQACPERQVLEQFLLGCVAGDQADNLEQHLSGCDQCAERASALTGDDELVAAMRAKQLPPLDNERVTELIERLRDVAADAETSRLSDTLPVTGGRSATALRELSEFLDPPQQPDEIGRIGEYRVLEVLGVGGMGIVLQAEDPHLKRPVAIKVMKGDVAAEESAKSRFFREARTTAAIEHDNIVTIYQVAEHRGLPYYAMQFLRGESLDDRLKREGVLDQSEVLRIGREIAEGLVAAHAQGLLHRDIKPDNIWLEEKSDRAKIVDFGLARDVQDDQNITFTGAVLGTPRYMAPEQALGKPVDGRCDLFSLGCVMYHLATGQPPFAGENLAATLMAVINKQPQPITQSQPNIDPELVQIIDRLLDKDPAARSQTADEVVAAVRRIEQRLADQKRREEEKRRSQPTPAELYLRSQRRRRVMIGTALVAGLLAIAFGIVFFIQTQTGVVRVEVNDDNLEVLIDGQQITLIDKKGERRKRAAKHRLAIKLNGQTLNIGEATVFQVDGRDVEHQLTVKLNGFDITSNEFEVVHGDDTLLTISFERRTQLSASEPMPADASRIRIRNLPSHAGGPALAIAPFEEPEAKAHQKAWADYLGLPVEKEVEIGGGEKMTFMLIPPGEFMMGSTEEEQASFLRDKKAARAITGSSVYYIRDEVPQHRVRITRPFYLGMCEVTQAQWQALMGSNPSNFRDHLTHPVEEVSWDDIQPFLAKLTEGLSATEPKFALPTEAQWEFACRAGTMKTWHSGDSGESLNEVAWFADNAYDSTHPVGRLKPNSFGLHDMHGNVAEWCADWHAADYYSKTPADDPTGPPRGSHRVVRGGGCIQLAGYCRSASRTGYLPDNHHLTIGFRLAMTIDTAKLNSAPPPSAAADSRVEQTITPEDGWVDLLAAVDVARDVDVSGGVWRIDDGELVGIYGFGLPVIPLGSYEWEIEFTPALGSGPLLNFTFPHPRGRAYAAVIGKAGLHDWHPTGSRQFTRVIKAAPSVTLGEKHLLKIALVIQDDTMTIVAAIDGEPWAEWSGETKSLTSDSLGSRYPAVWSSSQLTIHASRLQMLDGEAELLLPGKAWKTGLIPSPTEILTSPDWEWAEPELIAEVNSEAFDGFPTISGDGLTMVFASEREGGQGDEYDLWISERALVTDPWGEPQNLGPQVNSSGFDETPELSHNGLTLIFAQSKPGTRSGDLFVTTRSGRGAPWSNAVALEGPVNTSADEQSPSLSEDGLTLIFCSNRPGGIPHRNTPAFAYDLWVSRRDTLDSPWKAPTNLGPSINTSNIEKGCCLSSDGLSLLFCNDDLTRTTRSDRYMAHRRSFDEPWSKPVRLPEIFQADSQDSEIELSSDGREVYVELDSDIYVIRRVPK